MVATGVVLLAFALRGNAVPLIDIEKHIFIDRHGWVDGADLFCAVACLYSREVRVGEHLRNEDGEAHRDLNAIVFAVTVLFGKEEEEADAVICVIDEVESVRVPLSNHLCGIETQEVSNIRVYYRDLDIGQNPIQHRSREGKICFGIKDHRFRIQECAA